MAVNIWLLVASIILFVIVVFLSFLIVVHYQSVDDKKSQWGYKVIAIIGYSIVLYMPLIFAIDTVNTLTDGPRDVMHWVFRVLPYVILAFAFLVLPFGYSLFGSSGKTCPKRFFGSILKSIIVLAVVIALSILFYFVLGFVVPEGGGETETESPATFDLYLISFFSLLGFVFLIVFSGVGLVSVPLSMISRYLTRPKPIPADVRVVKRHQFQERAARLSEEAKHIRNKYGQRKMHWNMERKVSTLTRLVNELDDEFLVFQMGCGTKKYNPLKYIFSLIFGVICSIVSLMIVIHYILSPLLGVSPFLNIMFEALYDVWDILGIIVMGLIGLYIDFAMISGVAYIGSRLFFGIPIHPLKAHKSTTADILYQCSVMLVTSLGLCSFLLKVFPDQYIHNSENPSGIHSVFGYTTQMIGFKYVFDYGLWVSVALFPISIIVLSVMKSIENKKRNSVSRVASEIKSQMTLVERAAVEKKIKTRTADQP